MGSGVRLMELRGTWGGAVECRSTWRTWSCLSKDQPHHSVETVGAGGRKVRLLLGFAGVECRLSSAPPISMALLSTRGGSVGIGQIAHCLLRGKSPQSERRAERIDWRALICQSLVHTHCVSQECVSQESLPQESLAEAYETGSLFNA